MALTADGSYDGADLRRIVDEYEALETTRKNAQDEQNRRLKAEEERGYDPKLLKRLIRAARRPVVEVDAEREVFDGMLQALRDFSATPLGAYAKGSTEPRDGVSELKRARAKKDPDQAALDAQNARDAAADTSSLPDEQTAAVG